MSERRIADSSWFTRHAEAAVDNDRMKSSDRGGEIVGIAVIILVAAFFAFHQLSSTGFFTSKFGTVEAILFYGSALFGVVAGGARAALGRRNKVRPLEIAGGILFAVTSVWLLWVFPFNFSHLADALPSWLRFALSWVSDDIGRVILILSSIGSVFIVAYTTPLYLSVRALLSKPVGKEAIPPTTITP